MMCPALIVGSAIAHVGVSTYYKEGKILATNESATSNDVKYNGLITTDYISSGGDSGGSVFIPSSNGKGMLVGIHMGASGNTRYVVSADNIFRVWNYTRY